MCGVFRQLLCHLDFKENFSCAFKAILGTVYYRVGPHSPTLLEFLMLYVSGHRHVGILLLLVLLWQIKEM